MGKNKQNKQADESRVPVWKSLAWSSRGVSLAAITLVMMYLSMYCTDNLGMPAALVGTILMVSKIFDGVTDLIAGWLVDNTHTRFGQARPYEFAIVGVWVCMIALFSGSAEWSMTAKTIWVFVFYTLVWSIFATLLNASETPYVIRAFGNSRAIAKAASFGGIIISVACMGISIALPQLIGTMGQTAGGWQKMMIILGVPLTVIGLLRFFFIKEEHIPVSDGKGNKTSIKDVLKVLGSNKYIWYIGIATMIPQAITGMGAGTYYFNWVVGDIRQYSAVQAVSIVAVIAIGFFPVLMKKFSTMQLVGGFAAIGLVGYVLNFIAGSNIPLLMVAFILTGMSGNPTAYLRSPIIMQIADYNESQGKPRMEGSIASTINFMTKVGQAVGSFVLGLMLSAGGYDGSLAVQSGTTVSMIRIAYSLLPAVLMAVVILCAIGFKPLDKFSKEKAAN